MNHRRALVVLISAAAIAAISNGIRQANGLFLYPITTDLSVGRGEVGLATALGFLIFGLILPFVGLASDRHGPEKVVNAYPLGSAIYNILWVVGACCVVRPSSNWNAAIGVRRRLKRNTNSLT